MDPLRSAYFAALMQPGDNPTSFLELFRRPRWMKDGACRGEPVDTFVGAVDPEPALAICAECPVVVACRRHALSDASLQGVWAA